MSTKSLFYLLGCYLSFIVSWPNAIAQPFSGSTFISNDYILDRWGVEDGLPVNSVQDILQASDGYLWFATHDGLVRFDGIEFKLYTAAEYEGLKSNRIHFIEEAADGSILIKTQGVHISRLKDGIITHLLSLDVSISGNGRGSKFYKDYKGDVWVGGDNGLFVYRDGSLQKALPQLVSLQVLNILHVTENEIWFTSEQNFGLYRIKNNVLTQVLSRMEGWEYVFDIYNDTFWIGSLNGLYRFKDEKLDSLFGGENLLVIGVKALSESEALIEDFEKGYLKAANGRLEKVHHPYDLSGSGESTASPRIMSGNILIVDNKRVYENPDVNILDIEQDQEGNIWLGTFLHGLLRIRPKLFKTYSTAQGLPGKAVYPLFQSSDSTIWVGTFGEGMAKIENGIVEADFIINQKINNGYLQSFGEKEDGTLLVSTIGKGLQFLDKNTKEVKPYEAPENLTKEPVFSIFRDSKNRLWVGSNPYPSGGLYKEENGTWERVSGKTNVPFTAVRSILETPSGELWFATLGSGLIRFDGKNYYNYTTADGLSSDLLRALHVTRDEEGTILWVGSEDKGIDRIKLANNAPDLSSITNYQVKDGLFDNSIHIILEDDHQRFWINSNRGIFRVDRSELNAFHHGEIDVLYSHGYTEQDGLLNREGNGGIYPAGFKAYDGYIWFPSQEGVVTFHPDSMVSNTYVSPVVIQNMASDERFFGVVGSEILLEPDERDLEITYASLSYTDPLKNQYRYILEGYDREWKNVGTRRTAYYTNLPAGTYTFRVQGSNNEGIWNTDGAAVTIWIAPNFYETGYFYLIVFFLSISIVLGTVKVRNSYFRKREERLKKEVATRTKELEERTKELILEKEKTEHQAKKLLELDEVKSRFFTNITHELRTPLTLIMGPLEQLVNEEANLNTEREKEQKEMMLRNSQRLLTLVDQLLDVSKLENKSVPINPEPVLIASFLKKCISFFGDAFENNGIGFSFTSTIVTNEAYIDLEKMEKVIANLISNAIKFTPKGGRISVHLDEADNNFIITISDTGSGISEEELPRIFDRFYRNEQTKVSGFGIGLSIAKELIELHHGTIEVKSQIDRGTCFTITLQKGRCHFATLGKETQASPRSSASIKPFRSNDILIEDLSRDSYDKTALTLVHEEDKTTILIVDDNTDMRRFIASILSENYRVVEAKNGADAYEKISQSTPDLIVADVMMPEMDGMELNRKLKESIHTASIPFVFLSAKTDQQSKISGIREGADIYLTKPFDANELKANVHNLLSARNRLREQLLQELPHSVPISDDIEKNDSDPFLEKLQNVLEEEYSNHELSIDTVQEKMYMSRSTLYRAINEKLGMNTQQFVIQFRLEKAKEMLIANKGNISEIAYACGFNSLSYFGKVFKEHFNISPSSFLKTQNELK